MAVYAPDCHKELNVYEAVVKDVTNVLWKGCGEQEPRHSTSRVVGLLCTDDDDVEELNEVCVPSCWRGCDKNQGGFKKLMWYEMMKEFNCKVTSTWSSCDSERGTDNFGKDGKGRTTQLDFIIGPMRALDKAHIHNDVKLWRHMGPLSDRCFDT